MTKVPFEIVEKLYQEAERILSLPNFLATAPGVSQDQFVVASLSNPSTPHSVRIIQSKGNITCDSQCFRWKSYKLCPHVLIVADSKHGLIQKFFAWHKTLKYQGTNLLSLTTHNLPKGRGKKATKATSIRKGSTKSKPKPHLYIVEDRTEAPQPAMPAPTPGSNMIFLLDFCNANVSKCYGCQGSLKWNNKIPTSPADLITVSKMKRSFFKDGIQKESPLTSIYFQFNEQCIKNKDSYFVPTLLYCPDDLKPHLSDLHKELILILVDRHCILYLEYHHFREKGQVTFL